MSQCKVSVAVVLLLILIVSIYSNTFQASWHLDDYQNIVENPRLKITNLWPGSIKKTFFSSADGGAYRGKKLYRPVVCLTFGLNYYFGRLNPAGYHFVNIMVHFLTAAFLFVTIRSLLRSPNLKVNAPEKECFIALLSATLWAVNPIQTQAVTYIVQRMAAMVTLFYLMGLFFYIKGRLEQTVVKKQILYFSSAFLCFLLALGSKENAALWPAAVIMVEMIFFQDTSRPSVRKRILLIFSVSVFVILLIGAFIFLGSGLGFSKAYENRPFTLMQRLLTEPRILIFYLSQIFYPIPTRLSIEHDIRISTSLFHPWTTLPSIFFIILLIGWSFYKIHKRPAISFAILFFFLNHLIEASIIPLELVFEHRNYLPSVFVFLPISIGLGQILDYYAGRSRLMHATLVSFITLLIIGLGCGTFIRNLSWGTEKSLWEDALKKAPASSRPYHNLAWAYYDRVGQGDKSLELYRKSLELKKHNVFYRQVTLGNIANVYYQRRDYPKAKAYWAKALALNEENQVIRYRLASTLIKLGDLNAASVHVNQLISKRSDHPEYLNLKGFLLIKQKRFEEALPYFRKCLKLAPYSIKASINRGAVLNILGEYGAAEWALRNAHANYRQGILPVLWLIDTNVKAGDTRDADLYLGRLFALADVNELFAILEKRSEDSFVLFPDSNSLYQKIAADLIQRSDAVISLPYESGRRLE